MGGGLVGLAQRARGARGAGRESKNLEKKGLDGLGAPEIGTWKFYQEEVYFLEFDVYGLSYCEFPDFVIGSKRFLYRTTIVLNQEFRLQHQVKNMVNHLFHGPSWKANALTLMAFLQLRESRHSGKTNINE